MKTPNAPICPRNSLEQQLGPIVARLWMLPGTGPALAEQPFDAQQALRQLNALEAELDASLRPAQPASESFVLLH